MSEYKALKGFAGLFSMRKGDVKEIKDEALVSDLLQAGYIEPVEAKAIEPESVAPEANESEANESEPIEATTEAIEPEEKPRARRGRGAKKEA